MVAYIDLFLKLLGDRHAWSVEGAYGRVWRVPVPLCEHDPPSPAGSEREIRAAEAGQQRAGCEQGLCLRPAGLSCGRRLPLGY